jgi:hypothetical protein
MLTGLSCCGCSFVKVGAMVFLCHDINDIFLESAKMARYTEHRCPPEAAFHTGCPFPHPDNALTRHMQPPVAQLCHVLGVVLEELWQVPVGCAL